MMYKLNAWLLAGGFLLGSGLDALALAVEDFPASEAAPTNSGYSFSWDYVYNVKGSSGVAVDHYWLLTAAHVADDDGTNLTVNGEIYTQQEVVFHSLAADPDGHDTADIALIRYDKPFPGYYPLAASVPTGLEVVMCGFGRTGEVVRTLTTAYFTETGTAHATKRWGTNKIDHETTLSYSGPAPLGATVNKGFDISISTTRPSSGGTAYEAGCNVYDSGGGLFYNDGGIWKLVGHVVQRYGSATFSGNFAVATTYYTNWIKSVITDYDSDMDGLPDWWESLYAGDATSMDAEADLDGDDFSNYKEWIADTNPTNGSSHFMIGVYSNASTLAFSSSTNREYQIQSRLDFMDTNALWAVEADWFPGASSQTVYSVTSPASNRYYRVRVRL